MNMVFTSKRASVSAAPFIKALKDVCSNIEKRSSLPILSGVLITGDQDTLTLAGTNLDRSFTTVVSATTDHGLSCIVPAHKLLTVLGKAAAADTIGIEAQQETVTVTYGDLVLTLPQIGTVEDYGDAFADVTYTTHFDIDSAVLLRALSKISFCASNEDTRYYLKGVYVHATKDKRLAFVATDGVRLGRFETDLPEGADTAASLIPTDTVKELLRLLKRRDCPKALLIDANDKHLSVKIGESETLTTSLVDGQFPDYHRLFPSDITATATMEPAELIAALTQVGSIATTKEAGVQLHFEGHQATVTMTDDDMKASVAIGVQISGDMPAMKYNNLFLPPIVKQIEGQLRLGISMKNGPSLLKDESDPSVTYLLMPMRR